MISKMNKLAARPKKKFAGKFFLWFCGPFAHFRDYDFRFYDPSWLWSFDFMTILYYDNSILWPFVIMIIFEVLSFEISYQNVTNLNVTTGYGWFSDLIAFLGNLSYYLLLLHVLNDINSSKFYKLYVKVEV